MDSGHRCRRDAAAPSAEDRAEKSLAPFDPGDPISPRIGIVRSMADDAAVCSFWDCEIEVPAKVLLAGFVIRLNALLTQPCNYPLAKVVPEAAGVDEVWL